MKSACARSCVRVCHRITPIWNSSVAESPNGQNTNTSFMSCKSTFYGCACNVGPMNIVMGIQNSDVTEHYNFISTTRALLRLERTRISCVRRGRQGGGGREGGREGWRGGG